MNNFFEKTREYVALFLVSFFYPSNRHFVKVSKCTSYSIILERRLRNSRLFSFHVRYFLACFLIEEIMFLNNLFIELLKSSILGRHYFYFDRIGLQLDK